MVGFNRRFSPAAKQARDLFAGRQSPLSILYRVNGGRVPSESWAQDPVQGGGRIIGEVCHFIDLMQFLTGAHTVRVFAESITSRDHAITDADSIFITLKFADGSNGTIAYLAEGDRALPKERVEIFGGVRMHRRFVADDPAAALIEASAEAAALVVGRHGPGGVPAGLLGSVSRAVVQHAHCPVFLVN